MLIVACRLCDYDNCAVKSQSSPDKRNRFLYFHLLTTFQDKTAFEHLARKRAAIVDFRYTRWTRDSYPRDFSRKSSYTSLLLHCYSYLIVLTAEIFFQFLRYERRYRGMKEARARYHIQFSNRRSPKLIVVRAKKNVRIENQKLLYYHILIIVTLTYRELRIKNTNFYFSHILQNTTRVSKRRNTVNPQNYSEKL